jgi:sodium/proline symporter
MTSAVIIAVVIVYLLVLLILGAWGSRDSKSMAGYYVAGKKLPSWVIAFSSNSTGESAWLLLGLTGMGYLIGIHAMWIAIGEVLGVVLAWTLVALPFKEYTDRYDSITVPDYLESRFQDGRHLLRIASFVVIFSMVTAYTAAQLTASGKAFSSFLGTSYTAGVLIGTGVVLFYTSVGGFKAVAYSDLLQGLLMFGGLLVLPIVGIASVGGWGELTSLLRAIDPNLLLPFGGLGHSIEGWVSALSFIGIGFAFLGAPQLLTRFMAARDREQILEGRWIAIVCIIVFDTGAILGGMAGRVLFPGLADSETILPTMSLELFPALFAGLYLVVVLAAIMSTVDSLLILASSAVVRDVIQQILHPRISEGRLSLYGKLTTVVIGGAALVFALGEVRMIFWFVLFAWSGLASAFTPVVLCSLFWKRTTRAGALAGMVAGFLTAIFWVLFFKDSFFDLYEMIPGFLAGFFATIGVSLVTSPPESAETEFDAVWRAVRTPGTSRVAPRSTRSIDED